MRRHKGFHHGPPPFRPRRGGPFRSLFWFIPLALLLLGGGRWGFGLLVLIGIVLVVGAFLSGGRPPEPHESPSPFSPPRAEAMPVEPSRRTDLLPAKCPNCGAPVNANDVRWTGTQSASCAYCGTNLPLKK